MTMLKLENIHLDYAGVSVLKGIDLEVEKGEVVALIGANGAGKTTTLRCISGLLRAHKGKVLFQGQNIQQSPPHLIASYGIFHVLEGRHLFSHLSISDNLYIGAYLQSNTAEIARNLEKIFHLFPRLYERRKQKAGTLSGGEQQMVALGRALMGRPKLLLLDEPSVGLAPIIVEQIFSVIQQIAATGCTILLVEQNASLALGIADRGYVIELGEIALTDTGSRLLKSRAVQKIYLGDKED
jgi:branched-chain amino acid transport system ATP-binding protein